MIKSKDWPALLLGATIAAVVCSVVTAGIRTMSRQVPTPGRPACDPDAYELDAAPKLRARMAAGAEMTECDLGQLDSLVDLARVWEREERSRIACENDLTECQWGWWDAAECRRYQEASRFDAALDALYDCAEAGQ